MKTCLFITALLLSQQTLACKSPSFFIDLAKQAQAEANAVSGEWLAVNKLIQQSEQALADGNNTQAIQLAKKARQLATLGKTQMMSPSYQLSKDFLK